MLRLPAFELVEPSSLYGALAALAEHGERALVVAGGTDLLPNMKHGLFEPDFLVSLAHVPELRGVSVDEDGALSIGAMTPLSEVAADPEVQRRAPALAQACSLIAGPQLRTMGTLGGNVMLDTRCQWYNQTHFWRKSLGYCMKKDGTACHVVEGGRKCVAAASNDSAPALMTLGASLFFERVGAVREVPIAELWRADGIVNKKTEPGEILTRIRIPAQAPGHRGAYGKLRDRGEIDFPLFGCSVRLDLDDGGRITDADIVGIALVAQPVRIKRAADHLTGTTPGQPDFDQAIQDVAQLAYKQCRPMANIPGDADYRREMVPVYVARTLQAAANAAGPVHHI